MLLIVALHLGSVPAVAQEGNTKPVRVRISQAVLQAFVVRKVLPEYPKAALERGIDGVVTISVLIDPHGAVQKTWDADGDRLLVPAVTDAAKQWKFRPYYLNKQPVEVESQVTVTFQLKGSKGTVR